MFLLYKIQKTSPDLLIFRQILNFPKDLNGKYFFIRNKITTFAPCF